LLATGLGLTLWGLSKSLGWGVQGLVRPRKVLGGVLQGLGLCIGFASKELALVLPVLVVSHVLLFESHHGTRLSVGRALRRHQLSLGLVALPSLLYFTARTLWLPFASLPKALDLTDRTLLFLDSCGRYLQLLVAPTDLSLFGAYKPLALVDVSLTVRPIDIGLGGLHFLAWAGLLWLAHRKQNIRFFALLLAYGGCFLPVSNLVPMATDISVSPRFLYLPLLPWGCLLAQALTAWAPRGQKLALAGALVLGLPLSLLRARDFASAESFWRYELAHNPRVPSVLGANAQVDEDLHQPILAATRRACTYTIAQSQGDVPGMSRMVSAFLHGAVRATPHAEIDQFQALLSFTGDLLRQAPHNTRWADVSFEIQENQLGMAALRSISASLHIERAHLGLRVGEGGALDFAQRAIDLCRGCPDIAHRAARMALLAGDQQRAQTWLIQAGLLNEPILQGMPLVELAARLSTLEARRSQGDPVSTLERELLVSHHDRVVDLVRLHPEWLKQVPIELRLRVVKSAAAVGAWDVARSWLRGLASDQELQLIDDEFRRTSPAYNARTEQHFPWVTGTCARAQELR